MDTNSHCCTVLCETECNEVHCSTRINEEMPASTLRTSGGRRLTDSSQEPAVTMSNSEQYPSRSTVNGARYRDANARLRLNGQGRVVAIRRVVALQQPGSAAVQRYQAVTPRGVVGLSHASLSSWEENRSHPVN